MEKVKENIAEDKEKPKEKPRSFGNKMFDAVFYPIIQIAGVWTASFLIAEEAKNGKGFLTKGYNASVSFLEPKLQWLANLSEKLWNKGTANQWADAITMINFTSIGGTLLVPVVKYFEDRREKISAYFDKMAGKEVNPSEVKPEPKQTYFSLGLGRITSIATVTAGFMVFGPKNFGAAQEKVTNISTDAIMKIIPNADEAGIRKKADVAVFDLMLTAISATITYVFSRKIASTEEQKKE
jgi:hypothetical protein